MRTKHLLLAVLMMCTIGAIAQQNRSLQYMRYNDQRGLNVFETPKQNDVEFDGVNVVIGGAMTIQYQSLSQTNSSTDDNFDPIGTNPLVKLDDNFNLATANLDINVQLAEGVRMHLRTYLSSQHHAEAWVKGGYLQIDNLDFINEGFMSTLMQNATIRFGHMEVNYGDTHFRRSDNGMAIHNPFIGNYIMDAFTTEVGGEFYYKSNGILGMIGVTNGRLNQSSTNGKTKPALVLKAGYDNEATDGVRFRLTGSMYMTNNTNRVYLYGGDRAGSRYYHLMELADGSNASDFSARFNPGLNSEMTAIMINPFVKSGGIEFFGVFETASGRNESTDSGFTGNRNWTQLGGELVYRFGSDERWYVGGRYNSASGQLPGVETDKVTIDRINFGGGWFLTKNIMAKVEYMIQSYNDYLPGDVYDNGKVNGIVAEAVISF